LALEGRAIGLARPATEIEQMECRHGPESILPGWRIDA